MDFVTDLLNNPAIPRLTTYTTHGRMELSGQTLANWQSKVANLLTGIGAQPGDIVMISAPASWQPAVIALGAWKIGCSVTSSFAELAAALKVASSSTDAPLSPAGRLIAVFTDDADLADSDEAADAEEIYLLSNDPFGRGVEESGGDAPFGINDFSPELRVQPDAFMGLEIPEEASNRLLITADLTAEEFLDRAHRQWGDDRPRAAFSPWVDARGLAAVLEPLAVGGSTVMVDAADVKDLEKVLDVENVTARA